LDQLSAYFERVAALSREQPPALPSVRPLFRPPTNGVEPNGIVLDGTNSNSNGANGHLWPELIVGYVTTAKELARRTSDLHRTLARLSGPAFVPEHFGKLYQRSIYQSARNLVGQLCQRLDRERAHIPDEARAAAAELCGAHAELLKRFRGVLDPSLGGVRIRCHGDYHLDQLLYTGKEFVVIDFEGEPARTLGERRLKRSPLRDVATMIRSFDYAAQSVFLGLASSRGRSPGQIRPEDRSALSGWVWAWVNQVTHEFVSEYVAGMKDTNLLPPDGERLHQFLELLTLEKALLEIDLELTHRPAWMIIPLRAALRILGCDADASKFCF
jgi:maltose alpha-D-glucosyltransferase/alpha-amylase